MTSTDSTSTTDDDLPASEREVDTVRPIAADDPYAAKTVVRAAPPEILEAARKAREAIARARNAGAPHAGGANPGASNGAAPAGVSAVAPVVSSAKPVEVDPVQNGAQVGPSEPPDSGEPTRVMFDELAVPPPPLLPRDLLVQPPVATATRWLTFLRWGVVGLLFVVGLALVGLRLRFGP